MRFGVINMSGRIPVVPTLELFSKSLPGRLYEFHGGTLTIGRDPNSDVVLEDKRVSSSHAKVYRQKENTYFVEDLKSYNHSYLDGQKLEPFAPQPLRAGSRIRICDFTFVFHPEAVEVVDGKSDDPTILSTLDDLSSMNLSSRTDRASMVLRAVLEINRLLGGAAEINQALGRTLEELFAIFSQAECGFILTKEPDGTIIPRATRHRSNPGQILTLSRTVLEHVIREGKGLIISDGDSNDEMAIPDSLSGSGIRTALCVPLRGSTGQTIGIIQLDSRVQKAIFGPEDLELLAAVAIPVGVVVENHRLLKERAMLAAAGEVQAALLPRRQPSAPGYVFWERYQPALEVGGDYYDYIPVETFDNEGTVEWVRCAVALADVSGKGMPAALLMANLCAEVRHLVRSGADPREVAFQINRELYDAEIPGRFITLLLVMVNARSHSLVVVNAGHLCPLIRRADGAIEEIGDAEAGMPLGVERDHAFQSVETTLAPGDVVVLFTDGVTEAMNRDHNLFGIEGLARAIETASGSPALIGESILRAVRVHSTGRSQSDDIAIVCFGRQ